MRRTMNGLRAMGAAGALLAAACGGGDTTPDGGMNNVVDMAPTVEVCATDNKPVALAPHYAIRVALNVNVKVEAGCTDACLYDHDAQTKLLLLADISQSNGNTALVTGKPCQIKIPPVALKGSQMPTQLSAPDALVQSVTNVMATAVVGGADTCSTFSTSSPLAILLGAKLKMPATDPLPTYMSATPHVPLCGGAASTTCSAATDTGCVCDQDGDGKLGATIDASGLPGLDDVDKVYVALRAVVDLDGQVFPPSSGQATPGQRIKGAIKDLHFEQAPVGCHHSPPGGQQPYDCNAGEVNSLAQLSPAIVQSPNTPSTFAALPVPDGYTCTQLVTDEKTLFAGQ